MTKDKAKYKCAYTRTKTKLLMTLEGGMASKMQVTENLSLLSAVFEDVVRAAKNLAAHYEDVGDSVRLSAVANELEGLEKYFSDIEGVVKGYLSSSLSHNGTLNGSRTMPTGQSAIKDHKLNSLIHRYWDIDEPTSSKTNIVNLNEKLARDTVANSLTFVDGHYTVGMPQKSHNQGTFETTVVEFTISSLNGKVSKQASAYTTERVTGNKEVVDWRQYQSKWKHLQDIEFPQAGPRTTVDVLIGADLLYSLKDVRGRSGEPIARLTPLGWTCIGNPDGKAVRIHANFTFFLSDSNKLSSLIHRYWDIDEPTSSKTNIVNPNGKLARDTVANSLTFVDGHYTVGMPWKSGKRLLPDNYSMAL
ncbi:hypothetical protein AWC38_SpisGene3221 [Stylophora pistillata]|uniref:Peptidase aspartic putative domain-containing protein n=1 Tax=Stylophora pistillata TaxID=50429 RepID=A0A2B4SS50_STYPI|nr:hypothetical protein AWC38_SpisGene3221 [Stylophora pistillata]